MTYGAYLRAAAPVSGQDISISPDFFAVFDYRAKTSSCSFWYNELIKFQPHPPKHLIRKIRKEVRLCVPDRKEEFPLLSARKRPAAGCALLASRGLTVKDVQKYLGLLPSEHLPLAGRQIPAQHRQSLRSAGAVSHAHGPAALRLLFRPFPGKQRNPEIIRRSFSSIPGFPPMPVFPRECHDGRDGCGS